MVVDAGMSLHSPRRRPCSLFTISTVADLDLAAGPVPARNPAKPGEER